MCIFGAIEKVQENIIYFQQTMCVCPSICPCACMCVCTNCTCICACVCIVRDLHVRQTISMVMLVHNLQLHIVRNYRYVCNACWICQYYIQILSWKLHELSNRSQNRWNCNWIVIELELICDWIGAAQVQVELTILIPFDKDRVN